MQETTIKAVHARQVMDCKFRPAVEVDVILACGALGRGAAPTGTSVGSHEAVVLRDNDPDKFCGKSVFHAVRNVNEIIGPAIIGMDAARALYTGMVTDTGSFSYSGVDSRTLAVASRLLESGFDLPLLMSLIKRRSLESVKFARYCYDNLQISEGGIPWLYIRQDVIDRFNLTPDKVSGALSCLRDIEGHPIYVLFADLADKIRVEFRSDRISIVDVAVKFGGGGHKCACGARLSSADTIPDVIRELEKYMPEQL